MGYGRQRMIKESVNFSDLRRRGRLSTVEAGHVYHTVMYLGHLLRRKLEYLPSMALLGVVYPGKVDPSKYMSDKNSHSKTKSMHMKNLRKVITMPTPYNIDLLRFLARYQGKLWWKRMSRLWYVDEVIKDFMHGNFNEYKEVREVRKGDKKTARIKILWFKAIKAVILRNKMIRHHKLINFIKRGESNILTNYKLSTALKKVGLGLEDEYKKVASVNKAKKINECTYVNAHDDSMEELYCERCDANFIVGGQNRDVKINNILNHISEHEIPDNRINIWKNAKSEYVLAQNRSDWKMLTRERSYYTTEREKETDKDGNTWIISKCCRHQRWIEDVTDARYWKNLRKHERTCVKSEDGELVEYMEDGKTKTKLICTLCDGTVRPNVTRKPNSWIKKKIQDHSTHCLKNVGRSKKTDHCPHCKKTDFIGKKVMDRLTSYNTHVEKCKKNK